MIFFEKLRLPAKSLCRGNRINSEFFSGFFLKIEFSTRITKNLFFLTYGYLTCFETYLERCDEKKNMIFSFNFVGLEEPMSAPLACRCINCWCWYNTFGVHFKCYSGWGGDFCQIDKNAKDRAFMQTLSSKYLLFL